MIILQSPEAARPQAPEVQNRCDLYYSEVIGNPIPEDFHSAPKTEEYRVLRDVPEQEVSAYMDLHNWSRAYWRVEFLPESVTV